MTRFPVFFRALLTLAPLLTAATTLARDEGRILIPGTSISLIAPDGFILAEHFSGVELGEMSASVMVTEMPAPMEEFTNGIDARAAEGGLEIESNQTVVFAGGEGRLLKVTHSLEGVESTKWWGLLSQDNTTALIVATVPDLYLDELSAPLKACVLSAQFEEGAEPGFYDGLEFRLTELGSFQIMDRIQNMLLLTTTGKVQIEETGEPMAIVGSSYVELEIPDLVAFATDRVHNIAPVQISEVLEGESLKHDGLPAYELVARGIDKDDGVEVTVYQYMFLDGKIYYIVMGIVREDKRETYLPEYRAMARGLELVGEQE